MNKHKSHYLYILLALVFILACNFSSIGSSASMPTQPPSSTSTPLSSSNETASATNTSMVEHVMQPSDAIPAPGELIYDVESSGTGPEKRAPYGDSYQINRFERPFLQDMTYVPDMDIVNFNLSQDDDWYYVTIELIGNDPENSLGINYGVEIDLDFDGFGDYILWTHPPYNTIWSTNTVQVFKDSNHDTGGLSDQQADENFKGDGYDTLVFDGSTSQNADPDLAWVRMNVDQHATIQFAFKKSLTGSSFMMGVVSDAGLKDVSKFDYNDHFTEADAGSPVRSKEYYPLGSLFLVDNTCWQAYGERPTAYQSKKLCPALQPGNNPSNNEQPSGCNPPPNCGGGTYDPNTCICN